MNLPEFLLARIEEDESMAASLDNCPYADGLRDDWPHIDPSRVLAECEAKRRFLLLPDPDDPSGFTDGWWAAHYAVTKLLASPYADHPDYDPAWRP
jgi:hypothetical protein